MKKTEQEIKLLIEKYPNVPAFAIPTTKNKPKGKTNSLTQEILILVNTSGIAYCWRTNTTGIYNEKVGMWIKSGSTKGASDLFICFTVGECRGRLIAVELKQGHDKLNPSQIRFKEKIEQAGGQFWEIRSISQFQKLWNELTS